MTGTATSAVRFSGRSLLKIGTIAGVAGGIMEVLWIMLYASLSGADAEIVARGVTQSVFADLAAAPTSVAIGLAIHMVLAVGLGVVIALAMPAVLPKVVGTIIEPLLVVFCLAGVWTMNFFVLLPIINVDFVTIVPFPVSFVSKILFGVAAAFVFWVYRRKANA